MQLSSTRPSAGERRYRAARVLNAALGGWLLLSAYTWLHSQPQFNNAVMVGCLITTFSVLALRLPLARLINTVLALWLLVSAFALPSCHSATLYNNGLLALVVFTLTLIPTPGIGWG